MSDGSLYTHNHFNEISNTPIYGIYAMQDAKGNYIKGVGAAEMPIDNNKDVRRSGNGHTVINNQGLALLLDNKNIQRAKVGNSAQLVLGESIVSVPHWTGNRYEAVNLKYVENLSNNIIHS